MTPAETKRVREQALLDAAAECESLMCGMPDCSPQREALECAAENLREMALAAASGIEPPR